MKDRELLFFEFVVIDNCNLDCSYCVNKGEFSQKPKSEMLYVPGAEIKIAEKIVELSRLSERTFVNLTGGDSLLSPHFVKVISILKDAKNISVQLITNLKLIEKVADDILAIFPDLIIGGSLHVHFRTSQEIDRLIAFLNNNRQQLKISLSQVNHELTDEDKEKLARIKERTGMPIEMQTFIPPWTDDGKVENAQIISDTNFVSSLGKRCCLGYSHFFILPNGTFYYDQWCNDKTRKTGDFLQLQQSNLEQFILSDLKKCPQTSCGCNYNVFNHADYLRTCQRLSYPAVEIFGPDNVRKEDDVPAHGVQQPQQVRTLWQKLRDMLWK